MKKTTSVLLFIVMLCFCLTGCGNKSVNQQIDTTQPEQLYFELKELPDIGACETGDVFEYFYEDGPLDEFKPFDKYGKIIPYLASVKAYTSSDSYSDEEYRYKFGLATTDGKIITSGIYDYIQYYAAPDGTQVLSCDINRPDEEFACDSDIIGDDGSWIVKTTEETFGKIYNDREYPFFMIYEKNSVIIYDFQGKNFFSTSIKGDIDSYEIEIPFVNSEKVIVCCDQKNYCYDLNGKKLYNLDLDDDKIETSVGDKLIIDGQMWGYDYVADLKGYPILDALYDQVYYDKVNNCFLMYTEMNDETDERIDRYSNDLELLNSFEINGENLEFLQNDNASAFYDSEEMSIYSAVDGKKVEFEFDKSDILSSNICCYGSDKYFGFYFITENAAYIYNLSGELLFKIDDAYTYEYEDYEGETKLNLFSDMNDKYFVYVSKDGKLKLTEISTGETREINVDANENLNWINLSNNDFLEIYSEKNDYEVACCTYSSKTLEFVVDCKVRYEFGEYNIYADKSNSYVLDKNQNVIMKITNHEMS